MAIRRCEKGHFYDTEKYKFCPVCMAEQKQTFESNQWKSEDKTIDLEESDRTVGYLWDGGDEETQPVVGWLVCVRGAECGRDWKLSYGRNDIGTQPPADILLNTSEHLKECRVCSVICDEKHKKTILDPGKGPLVYYNNKLILEPVELKNGDEIGIEGYVLCFQGFCGIQKNYW